MAKKGVKLSFSLAKDVREVVGRVLGDNGQATTGGSASTQPRKPRFYQAPAGGIATPISSTQPSSAVCTLMKFNAAGTTLEPTNTTETVFSFTSFSAGEIFEGKQVGGKIFANSAKLKSGGMLRGLAEVDFDDTTETVDVSITFTRVVGVAVGEIVTTVNYIGVSGDQNGECYVWYHGDREGATDGTFDLISARCPV